MDEGTQHDLLRLHTALSAAMARLDSILQGSDPVPEDILQIRSTAASLMSYMDRRDRADLLRFVQAVHNEDEAWLILHVKYQSIGCVYHGKLTHEQRAVLGR